MKIFTYLRTLWHEFWMYMNVGPASPEVDTTKLRSMPELPKQEFPAYLRPKPEPLKANATVYPHSELSLRMSEAFTNAYSHPPIIDFRSMVKSDKKFWVYNVSRVDHEFDHPMLGQVRIPANDTKKRYAVWTSFPEVVTGTRSYIDDNEVTMVPLHGKDFVEDVIKGGGQAIGRDLSVKGVFWSYNNPPTIKEVNAAVRLMKQRYADLLEKAAILYANMVVDGEEVVKYRQENPDISLAEAIDAWKGGRVDFITPEHHAAAEYFKVTTPWHPVLRS